MFDENDEMKSLCDKVASPLAAQLLQGYNGALVLYGQTGSGKTSTLIGKKTLEQRSAYDEVDQNISHNSDGMIVEISKEIFQLMKDSSKEIEFTVKISYLEIYLEQIRDLLLPSNRFLKIKEDDVTEQNRFDEGTGPKIEGLSEVCCVAASDVISLVEKGHAYRVISEQRKGTDLSRSHSVLSIKIEQKNLASKRTIKSTLQIVDMAGIEVDESKENKRNLLTAPHSRQLERSLSSRSHSVLDSVVKSLEGDDSSVLDRSVALGGSNLTSVLRDALGGNSLCTFLLTASPASINIHYTLSTLRYGQRLERITNYPVLNMQASSTECNIELEKSKKIQAELSHFIRQIDDELHNMKRYIKYDSEHDLWNKLNEICSKNKYMVENVDDDQDHPALPLEEKLKLEQGRVASLHQTIRELSYARDMAQKACDTLQGECLFLRKESDDILHAKKKNTIELIDVQNEIQTMSQRKIELEHNLRTSRFRESEAVAFLRHFRRFYRRLLEKLHAQGSGDLNAVVSHMVGAPDLSEMTDLDILLMESGLLEDSEIGGDADVQDYIPSTNALLRSSSQANSLRSAVSKSQSSPDRNSSSGNPRSQSPSRVVRHLESIRSAVNRSLSGSAGESGGSQTISTLSMSGFPGDLSPGESPELSYSLNDNSKSTDNSPPLSLSIPRSPSMRLSDDKVVELESEVLAMTKRCIDLQTSLNSAEETIETLSARRKNATMLKKTKEQMAMKSDLEKKSADLEAIVWKMNELHLVNRSYSDKLSSRDQHIAFLEESLRKAEDKNLQLVTVHIENEKKMRDEVDRLNSVIDSMTTKLWQDGELEIPLERRILVPFQGSRSVKSIMSEGRDESEVGHDENKQNSLEHNDSDIGLHSSKIKLAAPFARIGNDPNIDVAALCVGGKSQDYVPRRFATKRGRHIKSATLLDEIPRPSLERGNSRSTASFATVRRQMSQLDQLTKTWTSGADISSTNQ